MVPLADRPHLPRRQALFESRREREFYRYYEPIRSLTESGPPLCDLFDDAAVKGHVPFSSPDPALTAFCQLAALRLGTRRAMLFFFDSNYAYVLAEATQTLSLKDDSVHEIDDKLWLGHSVIPRGFSICEETVCSLPQSENVTPDSEHHLVHIINDLEKDTQFCDRPYVKDGPKARFYAGVPITTPKGINIGAFCLLDDKKRDGLDEKGISFLKDMASTVMKHLDHCRAKAEHIRGTRMVTGLGAFIEGASSLRTWQEENKRRTDRQEGGRSSLANVIKEPLAVRPKPCPRQASTVEVPTPSRDPSDNRGSPRLEEPKQVDSANPSSASVPSLGASVETKSTGALDSPPKVIEGMVMPTSRSAKTSQQSDDLQAQLVADNVRSTFQRAADLIREAVDVEGAFFLDAAVGTYGGLVEAHDGSDQSSDALISGTDATGNESEEQKKVMYGEGVPDKLCTVLASSHTTSDHYHSTREMQAMTDKSNITERFLRSLLRRYGHGKIWNFNDAGDASSDDDSSESGSSQDIIRRSSGSGNTGRSSTNTRKDRRRRNRINDGREIQRLFPGVRSFALVGMWDQTRGRWFSACAVYTYSPLRLFSAESETSYIAAFCDVIIAEVHRLEAQNSDRAKSDFISSISHELRSPLHGILGSVECLQDQKLDSFSTGMVSQIEICGRTLLDIVDHLLDFSKVNHLAKTKPLLSESQGRRRISSTTARISQLGGLMSLDTEVALDEVTEEVVDTAVYSFCCARDKTFILNRDVSVILDVDRSVETSWKCRVPLGGWKRICINLLSNALKYTDAGFIHVTLSAAPIPGKKKRFNVIFEVKDSGRGMRKEFLENHLFKAFSQEDTLMEGTGLGMSLVAKIVKAMGGKIEVQSERGVGTKMTVTAPFERSIRGNEETANGSQPELYQPFKDSSVGIFGFDGIGHGSDQAQHAHQIARALTLQSVQAQCQHLGLHVQRLWLDRPEPKVQVLMLAEEDIARYRKHITAGRHAGSKTEKPTIILCSSTISARNLKRNGLFKEHDFRVEYIAQPCTSSRLASALGRCLGHQTGRWSDHQEQADSGVQFADYANAEDVTILTHHRRGTIPVLDEVLDEALLSPRSEESDTFSRLEERPAREALTRSRLQVKDEQTNRSRSTGVRPHSTFPVVDLSAKKPSTNARNAQSDGASTNGLSLLLVDDNQINLQLLINYARKQGHRKRTASDGAEAVRVYKEAALNSMRARAQDGELSEKPSTILMDLTMPVMNGFEATREIRAFEQQHGIAPAHIIALTGLGSANAQQEAFSSGVDLFLTKPVRLKELTKLLDGIRDSKNKNKGRDENGRPEQP